MKDVTIHLVRHGQSLRNTFPDLMGQDPEEPLSEKGRGQADMLGTYLKYAIKPDRIFSSPYARAKSTAELACAHLENPPTIEEVDALREYSAGDMTGKSRSKDLTPEIYAEMDSLGMNFKFNNGESLYEVEMRAARWLTHIIKCAPEDEAVNCLVFSHGMTIKCLLHFILQFDQHMTWRVCLENTSVTTVHFTKGKWHLGSINSIPHLLQL
jgi:broad specificity phosphatase PhoE